MAAGLARLGRGLHTRLINTKNGLLYGTVVLGDSTRHPIMCGVKFIHQGAPYGPYLGVSAGSHAHTKIVVGHQVGSGGG